MSCLISQWQFQLKVSNARSISSWNTLSENHIQNDLFVDCYSEDEDDFYTDSEDEDFEEIEEEQNQLLDDKKGNTLKTKFK